jgi:hypothetical protein
MEKSEYQDVQFTELMLKFPHIIKGDKFKTAFDSYAREKLSDIEVFERLNTSTKLNLTFFVHRRMKDFEPERKLALEYFLKSPGTERILLNELKTSPYISSSIIMNVNR